MQNFRPEACNFIKNETLTQVFSCEFCEVFKNTFFHRAPPAASVYEMQHRSEMGYSRNMIWKKMFIRLPEFRMQNFYLTKPYKVLSSIQQKLGNHRSNHRRLSIKKGVLKNFRSATLFKKESNTTFFQWILGNF